MRAVRRLGFRCAAASDDPLLRRVSRIDRGCAAALPESFSFPIVGSCRPCPGQRLCRGVGRLVWRHRERAMRCRAEFANKPRAPHPNEPVAGTELPCIVRHFRVRVHPRSRDGRCARRDAFSTASGAGARWSSAGPATAGRCTVRRRAARGPGARGAARRASATGARRRAARRAVAASGATGSARRTWRARRPGSPGSRARGRPPRCRSATSRRRLETPVPKKPLRTTLSGRLRPL